MAASDIVGLGMALSIAPDADRDRVHEVGDRLDFVSDCFLVLVYD
jgi:hypothetical protein